MESGITQDGVQKALRQFDNAASDLLNSNFDTFDSNLKRFVHVLNTGPILSPFLAKHLPEVNFDGWYEEANKTVGGMVGSGKLNWPVETPKRLSLQKSLLELMAANKEDVNNFCCHFMYRVNNFDVMVGDFTAQIVRPFVRDMRELFEEIEFVPEQPKETPEISTNRDKSTEPLNPGRGVGNLSEFLPWQILQQAIMAVPAVKYALDVRFVSPAPDLAALDKPGDL